jgi:RNA polymerase sigma-70 factor (ECF subfamily)
MTGDAGVRAALVAARTSYGRMLAWLAWRWRDITEAEDALSDAFLAALQAWPATGVPRNPEGWLVTVAERALLKSARRIRVRRDPAALIVLAGAEDHETMAFSIPDERLRLMLVCAHPAIDSSVRTALMLNCVLGMDAQKIARLFIVSPDAMAKRLVRAKAKIKQAALSFEMPDRTDLPGRIGAVLEAIYACYTADAVYDETADRDFRESAISLARIVVHLAPDDGEGLGLLALLLFCEGRRPAQFSADGRYVPLDEQDPDTWSGDLIDEADMHLRRAFACGRIGSFQLEAAIQSAHCSRREGHETPWRAIAQLYEALVALAPTIGARIGRALAVARAHDAPREGLALLDQMDAARVSSHQSWWAARAYLFERAGLDDDAVGCCLKAIERSSDPRVVADFQARIRRLRPKH